MGCGIGMQMGYEVPTEWKARAAVALIKFTQY